MAETAQVQHGGRDRVARRADRRGGGGGPRRPPADGASARSPVTGMRSTVPQGQPSSGCGHSPCVPQLPQRTVTHSSRQERSPTAAGTLSGSSGAATGAPQAQGYAGAV